jgi:hypothetical protein
MNVDELRTALHEPPPPLAVDLDRVVARGRRRRAAHHSGLAAAVLAVVAVVTVPMAVWTNGRPDVETAARPPVPATARPTAAAADCARIDAPAWGDVIRTGDIRGGRERVYWFIRITKPPLRAVGSRFSLVAGWRTPDARCLIGFGLSADPHTVALEYEPGFHSVYTSTGTPDGPRIPAGDWSTVGWYVGPVAKVTATIGGKPVTARLARWSVGQWPVALFWFSADTGGTPAHLPVGTRVTGVTAYDAAGRILPAGRFSYDGG